MLKGIKEDNIQNANKKNYWIYGWSFEADDKETDKQQVIQTASTLKSHAIINFLINLLFCFSSFKKSISINNRKFVTNVFVNVNESHGILCVWVSIYFDFESVVQTL